MDGDKKANVFLPPRISPFRHPQNRSLFFFGYSLKINLAHTQPPVFTADYAHAFPCLNKGSMSAQLNFFLLFFCQQLFFWPLGTAPKLLRRWLGLVGPPPMWGDCLKKAWAGRCSPSPPQRRPAGSTGLWGLDPAEMSRCLADHGHGGRSPLRGPSPPVPSKGPGGGGCEGPYEGGGPDPALPLVGQGRVGEFMRG